MRPKPHGWVRQISEPTPKQPRPSASSEGAASWFDRVLLKAATDDAEAMAQQEKLQVLSKERRQSLTARGTNILDPITLAAHDREWEPGYISQSVNVEKHASDTSRRDTATPLLLRSVRRLPSKTLGSLLGEEVGRLDSGPAREDPVYGGKNVEVFLKECRIDAVRNIQGELSGGLAGMGLAYTIDDIPKEELHAFETETQHHTKLGELASTAICGNDITASCFYIVGELSMNAGIYAPICTILSSFTLFCFRSVYGEVVTALPLNGGIYNLLLNSSTKRTASVTACLTILSYTATGVVSSVTAASYVKCSPFFSSIEVVPTAIGILGVFAVLMLMGMKESSVVASLLFLFHLSILFILSVFSVLFLQEIGLGQLWVNMSWSKQPSLAYSIFFGFSSAMLGVSGFETSANFVEEQRPGVFPKTLTNMWVSVSIINVCIPTLAICILPLDDLVGEQSSYALAMLAERVAGSFLRDMVAVDALLVLSGSVLTSYVGVCGLFQRMAGDRCLPEFFSETNSWRGTPHWTILSFFAVCGSMCFVLNGDITLLAAIYSISFLLVMGLFAFCGLWMKIKRPTLPRQIDTPPFMFALGLSLVCFAFTAVVLLHPEMLTYFYIYYGITVLMVMTTFARISIFTAFLSLLSHSKSLRSALKLFIRMDVAQKWILMQLQKLRSQGVVYFTKSANLSQINQALQYIEDNEEARWVRIVHVYSSDSQLPARLLEYVQILDCVYPKTRIDCILVQGEFGPALVQYIAKRVQVPVNCMFINCPKHDFKHPLDTMGGVRVILNSEKSTLLEGIKDAVIAHEKSNWGAGSKSTRDLSPLSSRAPSRSASRRSTVQGFATPASSVRRATVDFGESGVFSNVFHSGFGPSNEVAVRGMRVDRNVDDESDQSDEFMSGFPFSSET